MQIENECICVKGNHEKYIIEGIPLVVHDEKMKINQWQLKENEWIKSHLSDKSINYIYQLPGEIIYKINGKTIYIVHYPTDENGNLKKHIKKANEDENEEMFSKINADIYLYGHTHESIYNIKNNKIYINPGTLGCPGKDNKALFGILDVNDEQIEYKQLDVIYNVEQVIEDIKATKIPGYENVLNILYK